VGSVRLGEGERCSFGTGCTIPNGNGLVFGKAYTISDSDFRIGFSLGSSTLGLQTCIWSNLGSILV